MSDQHNTQSPDSDYQDDPRIESLQRQIDYLRRMSDAHMAALSNR